MQAHPLARPGVAQGSGLRDPFAWREALSAGASSASTHHSSRPGSRACSHASTPRSMTPPSPAPTNSARSSRSNLSARSGYSARGGNTPPMGGTRAPAGYPYNAGAPDNHSARTSTYHTPVPSARSSDYVSAYEGSSACATARTVDNGILLEEEPTRHETPKAGTNQRRQKAIAAAMDAFVPTDSRGTPAESGGATSQRSAPSLDPRKVLSAARHGRHKEVEASLGQASTPLTKIPLVTHSSMLHARMEISALPSWQSSTVVTWMPKMKGGILACIFSMHMDIQKLQNTSLRKALTVT